MAIEIDKNIFSKKYPINDYAEIWNKLSLLKFTKKTTLPSDILCFLEQGTVRKYIMESGKEINQDISVDFYFEGDIFCIKPNKEIESEFIYEPINNGILWYVSMDEVRRLFLESKLCATTQKVHLEEELRNKTIREIQLLKSSSKDIYLYLLKNKPHFIEKVPLKFLASYIGITPQALSRIRKQIS